MSLIRIDHHPSRRQLTVFGLLWLLFFGIGGGIVLIRSDSAEAAMAVWAVAMGVPAIGWLSPGLLRLVYLGMAYAAFPIGFVVSHLILLAVYYVVLTPIGLAMRCVGYDPMHRRIEPEAETYWTKRESSDDVDRYFRQF